MNEAVFWVVLLGIIAAGVFMAVAKARGLTQGRYAGMALGPKTITYQGVAYSLAGAQAVVDQAGNIGQRVTATRLVLTGPLALAMPKKRDFRELYLSISGPGYGWVVKVNPNEGMQARQFAAMVNARASAL